MLKYAALLLNTISLLMYQFFFAEGITITQQVPSSVKAGEEFTVELTINKGNVGGFAKLQQDLPAGFTAVQDDNNGASFTFSNQSVKFIWMSLPADKEFKVKYKVKVDASVTGDKVIGGKFSYVSDNVKQAVDIAPSTITVGGDQPVAATTPTTTTSAADNTAPVTTTTTTPVTTTPDPVVTDTPPAATTTAANTTTAADNSAAATTASTSSDPGSIKCTRNVPASPGKEFTVEILVNKGNTSGFAKLMETLPAGFTATAMESAGGSFSFDGANQKVKFVWVSMPASPEFRISYKVSVAASVSGPQPIDGVFSYIENDETKKFVIPTTTVNIGGAQPLATTTTTTENKTPDNTSTTANTTGTTDNTASSAANNTANTAANNTTTSSGTGSTDNAKAVSATTIPSPQGNVNFRVQIMALLKPVDANVLATRYNINQRINTEMAGGFTKYTVGSHSQYKEARDARENMKDKGVKGPFVTAYNSGSRITVQEALMITNQKWFR